MERLIDDNLLTIVKKVATFSTRNLFRLRATFFRHQKLANNNEVLWALPRRCLLYLSDCQPCAEKCSFMQQLSCSGHAVYCVALVSQLFQQRNSELEEIKKNLHKTAIHGSDGAKYFLMMLNVLARGGFPTYEVFPIFKDLFERQQLANCKRAIINIKGCYWLRALHPGLEYKFMCTSHRTCKGDGRKPNIF